MKTVQVKQALSLLDRVHLSGIKNKRDGSLQYTMEGIVS